MQQIKQGYSTCPSAYRTRNNANEWLKQDTINRRYPLARQRQDPWRPIISPLAPQSPRCMQKERGKEINKLHTKLPLILLCTIMIDDGLFDCRVLPQQGRKRGG